MFGRKRRPSVATSYFRSQESVLQLPTAFTREALMLPRDKLGTRLTDHQESVDEAEDFLGYSLVAATVAVGVVLAVVFAAF
jgi:hypothetical protein